ncbi:oxalate/formate MFS antiporter [Azospirillum sp. ST 5-10]|uniref:oxalate/formate MFS antiporter n=1 Tax=unclassified Azospirillum TaxID=2630922 RepID=UPI003F49D64C
MFQEETHRPAPFGGRWMQLAVGIVCMSMIANLQYGWTLFVEPIDDKHDWGRAAIQVAFTIFVVTETWLVPVEGWFVDRYGPRIVVLVGGVLCALSWALNAVADSLPLLYLAAAIGGIGAGGVYGTCVGNALKWFPDRRGLAAGLTAAGFGAGSALTVVPIAAMIAESGYEATFLAFGLGQGLVVFALAWLLVTPPTHEAAGGAAGGAEPARRQYAPAEMVRTPVFWVMYAMFVMVGAGGLMVTAQLGPIAGDYGLTDTPVSLFGLTLPALTFALSIDRVLNGVTRPFFGWVSDRIGRENTMFVAFALEALGIVALALYGRDPVLFVVLTGLVFFAWGEIYSLFPACCGDSFGSRFAATNAGLLYTAKGTAALLVPFANLIVLETGSWQGVFYVAAAVNLAAALLALLVLKPLRARHAAGAAAPPPALAPVYAAD